MFKSIVAASVHLDGGCMRLSSSCYIQEKSDCISDLVMQDIIKVSIDHYAIENKCFPERLVLPLQNIFCALGLSLMLELFMLTSSLQNSFLS